MTLLKEATIDDQFNTQMGKIQQAIIALEKLVPELVKIGPVGSQRTALQAASSDIRKISESLINGRLSA